MKSLMTTEFVLRFQRLSPQVQAAARKAYRLWQHDRSHPSLHFKRIHSHDLIFSVRISLGWRALGLLENETIHWFWIGSHAEYDSVIRSL